MRLRFTVKGRVQAVGFRWFVQSSARTLGLGGWVRNREDLTVEGEAQGSEEKLGRFLKDLRRGPPSARVEALETQRLEPIEGQTEFEIV